MKVSEVPEAWPSNISLNTAIGTCFSIMSLSFLSSSVKLTEALKISPPESSLVFVSKTEWAS